MRLKAISSPGNALSKTMSAAKGSFFQAPTTLDTSMHDSEAGKSNPPLDNGTQHGIPTNPRHQQFMGLGDGGVPDA